MQKTAEEIIQETIDYYGEDPEGRRAQEGSWCSYMTEDGRMCAFGRCCVDAKKAQKAQEETGNGNLSSVIRVFGGIDSCLKPEYRGHPLNFWYQLQELHDTGCHWGKTGLSQTGRDFATSIPR